MPRVHAPGAQGGGAAVGLDELGAAELANIIESVTSDDTENPPAAAVAQVPANLARLA